jgi:hypothetical protein
LMFSPFLVLFFVPSMLGIGADLRSRKGAPMPENSPA